MLKLIWPDPQIPYQHKGATAALCNMIADRGGGLFDEIHQCGDMLDMTALGRWVRGTPDETGKGLQKELNSAEQWLEDIYKAAPDVPMTMIRGNHDDRLAKYLATVAKGLDGLSALRFENLTKLEDYGWVMMEEPYKITSDTVVVHGLTVRSKSGYTAHAHIDKFFPLNVVHGHTHRGGVVYRTINGRTSWAMESGNTMNPKLASYVMNPDWQLGFGLLQVEAGSPTVPHFVPMKNDGSFFFDGRRWTP